MVQYSNIELFIQSTFCFWFVKLLWKSESFSAGHLKRCNHNKNVYSHIHNVYLVVLTVILCFDAGVWRKKMYSKNMEFCFWWFHHWFLLGKFFFPLIMGQGSIENCQGQAKVKRNCSLTIEVLHKIYLKCSFVSQKK